MSTQKTIRLDGDHYRIDGSGTVERFASVGTGYQPDYGARDFAAELAKCESRGWHPTPYRAGAAAILPKGRLYLDPATGATVWDPQGG